MLSEAEYLDLWSSVRVVQGVIGKKYDASAFNVAVQDGRAAGQSVPHVHVHILPRKEGDFERNDDVYDALEAWAPREDMKQAPVKLDVPNDVDRVDRTAEAMAKEAAMYREILA
jgi:bis(5'-adenosyl)-triphosphatase